MKRRVPLLPVLAAALFVGCAVPRGEMAAPIPVSAPSDADGLPDMRTAVAKIVAEMREDAAFQDAYGRIRAKKESVPVIQIGNIENVSGERAMQRLESARRRLEVELRRTGLFEIADDAASGESVSDELAESLVRNAETGLKAGTGLQHFGEHAAADCQLYGRYRTYRDGGRDVRELSLQIVDLATGKQIWSDLVEVADE